MKNWVLMSCLSVGVLIGFLLGISVKNDNSSKLDTKLINNRVDYYYKKTLEEIYLKGQNQKIAVYPERINKNDVDTLTKLLSDSLNLPYDEVKTKIENKKSKFEIVAENVDSKTIDSIKYKLSREFATEGEGSLMDYFSFHLATNEE